jgi:hypothetical protein
MRNGEPAHRVGRHRSQRKQAFWIEAGQRYVEAEYEDGKGERDGRRGAP